MSYLYKGQSNAPINIDTGVTLATASPTKILYTKPDGTKGEWEAAASTTILTYAPTAATFDQIGEWKFQAYFVIDGKHYYGDIVREYVHKPLNQ